MKQSRAVFIPSTVVLGQSTTTTVNTYWPISMCIQPDKFLNHCQILT